MIKIMKAFIPALLAVVIVCSFAASAAGSDITGLEAVIADTAAYLQETVTAPGIGQTGGEWAVIALMRSGARIPDDYIRAYYDRVADHLDDVRGLLSTVKYSEYSRVALAISAIGANPRDIGGYDMIAPLLDYDMTINQGINGPIFALIALSGAGYGGEPVTERYIGFILGRQLEDGGFTMSGTTSDPDTTAMALTALAVYRSRRDVSDVIEHALTRLSQLQRPSGGFTSFSSINSESVSQVIIALCSLGIPVDDERFVKDGNSLFDNLMSYCERGRGFEHESGGGVSLMSTEQALCALAALRRFQAEENPLYDMRDAPAFATGGPQYGLEGKHPDVNVPVVANCLILFDDIRGHENEAAIRALAERCIVNGYSTYRFAPSQTITRAEFAAVIVRALGLRTHGDGSGFRDVPAGSWFFEYAQTASEYGIIQGRSADVFDPGALITRQEAAVMISRAAALCGLSAALDETGIRNVLSQFIDYRSVAPWASGDLALCYYFGILDDNEIEIKPVEPLLRGETAEMVYRMLRRARLV